MKNKNLFRDTFNLLCGSKISNGAYREVFECNLNSDWVVKIEDQPTRTFHNVYEFDMYRKNMHCEEITKWLAPCHWLSPEGMVLIQSKCEPIQQSQLPKKVPSFLTDLKLSNFGMLDGKIVCFDYGMTVENYSTKEKKADW